MGKKNNVNYGLERRKVATAASMASLLVVLGILNYSLVRQDKLKESEARSIASVQEEFENSNGGWVSALLNRIPESQNDRFIASVGRQPSALEKIDLGVFKGKYRFKLSPGQLLESARFEAGGGDRPIFISDKESFLHDNKEIFDPSTDQVKRLNAWPPDEAHTDRSAESQLERSEPAAEGYDHRYSYQLLNEDGHSLVVVHFFEDGLGRLIGLQVEKEETRREVSGSPSDEPQEQRSEGQ
ncbi:MAG: hypothetical protein COT74_12360 [Bdellovibrionales bacterium CG10_big_fil_rev_8_21_14_0_10_45_34]|nr:MAG: hypothetical protein COT74_12360 [Bdellovibrionales bacterium CG10_big_fil_rev_8_21_14_0_10_45_34]